MISLVFLGCNSYEKILKSSDMELKYQKAQEYYEKEDYYRAKPLLEELISVYKGTKSVEKIYYYYSFCEYGMSNFLLAAYHFRNLYQTYPRSEYAEEAQYMQAFSYFMLSPGYNLDQEYTNKAIEHFQLFINSYPDTDRAKEANGLIDKMRRKLEQKALASAKLYYNLRQYKAAALSFDNLLREYPDTQDAEEAHFYIIQSYYQLAERSIAGKQKERYRKAVDAFTSFKERYPESKWLKNATNLNDRSLAKLEVKVK
jgi:outer membrane protein assembly factor BamD